MMAFLQNAPIRALILIYALVAGATLFLLQISGLNKSLALWLFAALAIAEIALIFGPKTSLAMGGKGKFIQFFGIMLVIGVGIYLYVALVMAPKAIERTQQNSPANQSVQE